MVAVVMVFLLLLKLMMVLLNVNKRFQDNGQLNYMGRKDIKKEKYLLIPTLFTPLEFGSCFTADGNENMTLFFIFAPL
jgi:hypothetical protein